MSRRLPRGANGVAAHSDDDQTGANAQPGHEGHQHPTYRSNSMLPEGLRRFLFRYSIESTCYMLDPVEIAIFNLFLLGVTGGTLYILYSWIATLV